MKEWMKKEVNFLSSFRILVWGLYLKCMEFGLFILNQLFTFCACPTWGVQRLRIREPHGNFFSKKSLDFQDYL